MTDDETRSEVERIARNREGAVSNEQLFDLVLAVSHDDGKRHKTSIDKIESMEEALSEHIVYAKKRDDRISALEEWRDGCPAMSLALFSAEHAQRHGEHMAQYHAPRRESDPEASDFNRRRQHIQSDEPSNLSRDEYGEKTWLMWMVGSWIGRILLGVVIAVVAGSLMLLVTYFADQLLHQ